jgi:hypothetical protein
MLDYRSTDERYSGIKCSLHVFRELSDDLAMRRKVAEGGEWSSAILDNSIRVVLDFEQDSIRYMPSDHGLLV